jgi:hypothetical protein
MAAGRVCHAAVSFFTISTFDDLQSVTNLVIMCVIYPIIGVLFLG